MPSAQASYVGRAAKPEWPVLLPVFVVGFLLIVSRMPDAIFNPQFYIEDGFYWYAQAHDLGTLEALTLPHRGYLVIVQRLGGSLASAFPLLWAPLVMALFGIALNVLPAVFIASSRFASVLPSLPRRVFLAFLCVAAPNAWSVMSSTTNTMWYLALLACLVVLASPPTRPAWRAFDLATVVLSGLSGPFAMLLAPVAALKWWFRRERWTLVLLLATTVVGLVQAASILMAREEHMLLGTDVFKLASLLVRRVIYEALFGQVGGMGIMLQEWGDFWTQGLTIALAGLAGLAMLAYTMLRAPLELRLFVVYAGLTLASVIAWSGEPEGDTRWWDLLMPASNGNRYFLMPVLAFIFTCAWMATAKPVAVRAAGMSLLAVALMVGVPLNWREPARRDFEFPAAAKRYQAAPVGAKVVIMTPPDHAMTITKKAWEPVVLVPDECTGDMRVAAKLLGSNQMTWNGGEGRAEGTDPYAIFGLPARLRVCGVRVKFVVTSLTGAPMLLQMWWAESGAQGFSEHERNSMVLVTPGPEPQSAVYHVRDTIDRIRLDPGVTPGTVMELQEVILLTRRDDQRR